METAKVGLKPFLLSLLAVLLVEFTARGTVPLISDDYAFELLSIGVTRLAEITFIFLIVSHGGNGLASIGLSKTTLGTGFKKGLIWSAGFGLLALLGFIIASMAGLSLLSLIKTDIPPWPWQAALYFLAGGLLAPVAEEVFFRGLIYGFLRRWGIAVALLMSMAFFVLAHSTGGSLPIPQVVGGIIFALAYELEDNLMVPVLIHASGNLAIFGLSLF